MRGRERPSTGSFARRIMETSLTEGFVGSVLDRLGDSAGRYLIRAPSRRAAVDPLRTPSRSNLAAMRRRLAAFVALLATLVACSSHGVPPRILSPAPRACPTALMRADGIPSAQLMDQMDGHVPTYLPDGLGLLSAWGHGQRLFGAGIWSDKDCREVEVDLLPGPATNLSGPRIGAWTLTGDTARDCGNPVQGENGSCLSYFANVGDKTLRAWMSGITRADGDAIVASIPT